MGCLKHAKTRFLLVKGWNEFHTYNVEQKLNYYLNLARSLQLRSKYNRSAYNRRIAKLEHEFIKTRIEFYAKKTNGC